MILQYATAKVGAILVNVNPAYRTTSWPTRSASPGSRRWSRARAFRQTDYLAMLDRGPRRPARPRRRRASWAPARCRPGRWPGTSSRRGRPGADAERLREREALLQFDDPINIQYTSGTTGFPKGATLSHHNILNNGFFIGERCGYTEADRVCIPVPLYHCFGMVLGNLGCITHGATMVYPAEAFDPEATLDAVAGRALHHAVRRPDDVHRRADHPASTTST